MINDINVIQTIKIQINKKSTETLAKEDFDKVEDIDLNDLTLAGNKKNINLLEIAELVNLKNISLQYFKIDDQIIKMLNSFKNLESITFICCEFENQISLENDSLKNINIKYCDNIDYKKITVVKNMRIDEKNTFNMEDLLDKNIIEYLSINNCKIKNFGKIVEFCNLKRLNLDGSTVDNKKTINLLKDVEISMKKESLPIA